jgi:hypothetical protein
MKILIIGLIFLWSQFATSYARDPDTPPGFEPPPQYPITWGEGVQENLNGVTTNEWFMVIGLTVRNFLMGNIKILNWQGL